MTARRAALLVVVGLVALGLGVALGQALSETDVPGGNETRVRTLQPVQLAPVRVTVTVTTTP